MSACACLAHALKLQTDIRHGLLEDPEAGKLWANSFPVSEYTAETINRIYWA